MLKKVVYVAVLVSDQDKALDFYTNAIGLEKRVGARSASTVSSGSLGSDSSASRHATSILIKAWRPFSLRCSPSMAGRFRRQGAPKRTRPQLSCSITATAQNTNSIEVR
jgi:hypothetical protein